MTLQLGRARPADADPVQLGHELVEQPRLAESRVALDLDQRQVAVEPAPDRVRQRLEFTPSAEEARRSHFSTSVRLPDGPRKQLSHVVLAEDGGFERACLRRRLEAELAV